MKIIIYLFVFNLLIISEVQGQDPYKVNKSEVGKKGTLDFSTNTLVDKYRRIWEKSKYDITKKLSYSKRSSKKYNFDKPILKWKIFVDESYNEKLPVGVLTLVSTDPLIEIPSHWKKLCKRYNLVLAVVDLSADPVLKDYVIESTIIALDLIKARYKVSEDRIFYGAFSNNVEHNVHLHSPSLFEGVIAFRSKVGWDYDQDRDILEPEQFKNRIIDTAKIKYYFIQTKPDSIYLPGYLHRSLKFNSYIAGNSDYKTRSYPVYVEAQNQFKSLKVLEEEITFPELFKRISYNNLDSAMKFVDSRNLDKGYSYYQSGLKKLKLKNFKEAFLNFLNSKKHLYEDADKEIENLIETISKYELEAIKYFAQKEYYKSYKLANSNIEHFTQAYAKNSLDIINKINNDQNIILEIKAAAFLEKAEAASKKPNPPTDKIKEACEKVIKTVPGTKTAEKAQALLDSLK